ncbi:hypothetical protein [Ralstonia pseudosolanacearum]|uniref:hypothetical protein n=1 Tax=Ralstonia pseudosolanacearum TaxID=1310165 RepID=UPI001FF7D405|nr:hypothetical protein [Ralstonia pseudosolanacearum]
MGGFVKKVVDFVDPFSGHFDRAEEAARQGAEAQAAAVREAADKQAAAVREQAAAQERQMQQQQEAASQALQMQQSQQQAANLAQQNLINQRTQQQQLAEQTPVQDKPVEISLGNQDDSADPRRRYQSGNSAASGVSSGASSAGVGIRLT